jgi:alanyl-tRNA synthetase
MSEDLSQAVPATSATEAVPPVRAIDSEDPALLKNKIELAKADREKAIAEKQSYKKQVEDLTRQMADLQSQQQKAGQDRLVKNQEFETLWKDASSTNTSLQDEIAQLKQQLQDKDVAFQQQQIKSAALNAIAQSGVVNPEQAFSLMKESLRLDENGNPVCLSGGVQVELNSHLNSLKQPGSGWEHHFSGSGARGMSAAGSSTSASGGKSWGSMGLMERIQLEEENPALAAQLKAQG